MELLVYKFLEDAVLFAMVGIFFISMLVMVGVFSMLTQKQNKKFQQSLLEIERKRTEEIARQTAALEKIAAALEERKFS